MANMYALGTSVTVTGTFRTSAGAVVDPTNVFFELKSPDGGLVTYQYGVGVQLTNPGVGVYAIAISASQEGVYYYRMYSTGVGQTSKYGQFKVSDFTK